MPDPFLRRAFFSAGRQNYSTLPEGNLASAILTS
jgi:hypothetical protein